MSPYTPSRTSLPTERGRQRPSTPNQSSTTSSGVHKVRTSHACDRCRLMRTKCSGGERCSKCTRDGIVCVYGDRKRERNKKDLVESLDRIGLLQRENMELVHALRSIAGRSDFQLSEHVDIHEILAKYSEQEQDGVGPGSKSQSHITETPSAKRFSTIGSPKFDRATEASGEMTAGSGVGSPGKQGELAEVVDLGQGAGASGYIGKMSEMSWIQRAFETLRGQSDKLRPEAQIGDADHSFTTTTAFNYFLDDDDILAVDEDFVDQYHTPDPQSALILSEAYFHAMQGAFPFVIRDRFLQDMFALRQKARGLSWSDRRWLALANLVWAIGSKWLENTKMGDSDAFDSHQMYYARARALGLDHRIMFDHPNLERVQGIGILSFYLLVNGSITRAWNTLGHATRHATALGLHLKVSDPNLTEVETRERARTWYSLYSLEILITEITGRPKSIFLLDVTIPIDLIEQVASTTDDIQRDHDNLTSNRASKKAWLEFLGEGRYLSYAMTGGVVPWKSFASVGQGVSRQYFAQRLSLCRLSDKISSQLYTGTSGDSWSEIQHKIGDLQSELRNWAESLPTDLAIQGQGSGATDPRVKIELSMYYQSLQMILHRPCLCQVIIENESIRSQEFNRSAARACVHAAMSMLAIMPDNPTAHEAYQLLPWWALLHFVAQATAVLLLELCLGSQHFPDETLEVVNYLRKAMAYLWCITDGSLSAYRAWRIFRQLLSEVSRMYEHLDLVDIPEEAPQPPGWEQGYEPAVGRAFD